jgi:hypothetical protein
VRGSQEKTVTKPLLTTFHTRTEAEGARGRLERAGIEASVSSLEHQTDDPRSLASGDTTFVFWGLYIPLDQQQAAREVLDSFASIGRYNTQSEAETAQMHLAQAGVAADVEERGSRRPGMAAKLLGEVPGKQYTWYSLVVKKVDEGRAKELLGVK